MTDVVMPQMGGRELVGKAGRRPAAVKVLFTSGYTDDTVVRHGVINEGPIFCKSPFRSTGSRARSGKSWTRRTRTETRGRFSIPVFFSAKSLRPSRVSSNQASRRFICRSYFADQRFGGRFGQVYEPAGRVAVKIDGRQPDSQGIFRRVRAASADRQRLEIIAPVGNKDGLFFEASAFPPPASCPSEYRRPTKM